MNYRPIDEANLADAAKHLAEAKRMNSPVHIQAAILQLKEQMKLIEPTNPRLCAHYQVLIQEGPID
jgi:hypothetical protein